MKIVLIHGQNHVGSSCQMGRLLAQQWEKAEMKEFFLPADLPYFCRGCYACVHDRHACPYDTAKMKIMEAVREADLLIITTPTYCMGPSAPLKSFLDLTFTWWMVHQPESCMFSKQAVVITAAAGHGLKSALKPVKNALFYWGIPRVYTFGRAVQAMGWDQVAEKQKAEIIQSIQKLAAKIKTAAPVRPGLKTKLVFEMMRLMQINGKGASPEEQACWKQQGWLDKKRPWRREVPD